MEIKLKKAELILKVIDLKNSLFDKIIVDKKEYKLEEKMKICIDFDEYESEMCSKIVSLEILHKRKNSLHNFEIIEGVNYGLLFTLEGKTRDLILYEDIEYKIEISSNNTPFEEINFPKIQNINRILFINLSSYDAVFINKADLTDILLDLSIENSIQACIFDFEKKYIPYKIIKPENWQVFFNLFKNYEKDAEDILNKIKNIFDFNNKDKAILDTIQEELNSKEYLSEVIECKFNIPIKILLKFYNENKYFNFISNCCVFQILSYFF